MQNCNKVAQNCREMENKTKSIPKQLWKGGFLLVCWVSTHPHTSAVCGHVQEHTCRRSEVKLLLLHSDEWQCWWWIAFSRQCTYACQRHKLSLNDSLYRSSPCRETERAEGSKFHPLRCPRLRKCCMSIRGLWWRSTVGETGGNRPRKWFVFGSCGERTNGFNWH